MYLPEERESGPICLPVFPTEVIGVDVDLPIKKEIYMTKMFIKNILLV